MSSLWECLGKGGRTHGLEAKPTAAAAATNTKTAARKYFIAWWPPHFQWLCCLHCCGLRGRSRQPAVLKPARWPVYAEAQLVHITVLNVVHGVLVWAVDLLADPKLHEIPADGHLGEVILVEEAASVSLHAEAPQPVCAHRLQHSAAHRCDLSVAAA